MIRTGMAYSGWLLKISFVNLSPFMYVRSLMIDGLNLGPFLENSNKELIHLELLNTMESKETLILVSQ